MSLRVWGRDEVCVPKGRRTHKFTWMSGISDKIKKSSDFDCDRSVTIKVSFFLPIVRQKNVTVGHKIFWNLEKIIRSKFSNCGQKISHNFR